LRALGERLAEASVFLLFTAVPLVASTALWDQFASVKWYALQALAVTWFLVELLLCGSRGWPWAARRAWLPCLVLFALPLPGALRLGLDWAAPPLAERLTVLGLALSSFWYFRRNGCDLGAVRGGLLVSTAVTCAFGLAQALGTQPWPALTAGDQRSALFGNVNMAAEFLGFATIALLAIESPPLGARLRLVREVVIAFALAELFFLASRSTFLALGLALLILIVVGRLAIRRLASLLLAAAVGGALALGVAAYVTAPGAGDAEHLLRADVQQYKRDSSSLRFAAWDSTIALIRDHPWGLGLGNFPDAFIPYQLEGSPSPSEKLYFRSPHNEALRLVADGGVLALPLALALLTGLGLVLWRSPAVARGRSEIGAILFAGFAFYLVEACFQFPLDVAMGALGIAVLVGLVAACAEPASEPARGGGGLTRIAWVSSGLVLGSFVGIVAGRVARSEWLFVNAPKQLDAQREACRLNPRNLPACVTAAWLEGRSSEPAAARLTLTRLLERSPYYFPAIKLLGEQALVRTETETACRYLWIYDEMFRRRSSVHYLLGHHCEAAWLESFRDTIPMPRYRAFPFAPGPHAP
jgi:O-antigen ligase